MEIPNQNNVYGYFNSDLNLDELAKVLKYEIKNSLAKIEVRKLTYDGTQSIFIESETMELESRKFDNEGKHSLNGAVAGNEEQIMSNVEELYVILKRHGYKPTFEIYNSSYECIGEFNA